jgi:hypothetical protein
MDSDALYNLVAAFIGAIVGGLFTMWGAEKNHKDQVRRDEKEESDRRAIVLRALLAEMETLAAIFMKGTGRLLEQNLTEPHYFRFYANDRNFVIFEHHCSLLGCLPEKLSRDIVAHHLRMNLLLQYLVINNWHIDRWEAAPLNSQPRADQYNSLKSTRETLNSLHDQVKKGYVALQADMRKFLGMPQTPDPFNAVEIKDFH